MPAHLSTLIPWFITALCIACTVITILCINLQLKNKYDRLRSPFKEMKRPVGEHLREQVEDLDDQINDNLIPLCATPVVLAFLLITWHFPSIWGPLVLAVIGSAIFVTIGNRLMSLIDRRRNCRLGFDGERYVGEELTRLIAAGFTLYHDVEFVGGGNIDHVAVGARGVFVIETKTRRKYNDLKGREGATVSFDGQKLYWPRWQDAHGVQQAIGNAQKLSGWIKAELKEAITVNPILTLPGWYVENKGHYPHIFVCNPKNIYEHCQRHPQTLEPALVEKICAKLNENCKIKVKN